MKHLKLTAEEHNMLFDIASWTGMDCWFDNRTDDEGYEHFYDLENDGVEISYEEALGYLDDGFVDPQDFFKNYPEYTLEEYEKLMKVLQI